MLGDTPPLLGRDVGEAELVRGLSHSSSRLPDGTAGGKGQVRRGWHAPVRLSLDRARLDTAAERRLIAGVIATKSRVPARPKEPRRWTFAEMAAELPETNLPTELWDGELVMSPAPSFFHQEIVARFYKLLDAWVEQHRLGKAALAPLDMVLAPHRAVQPDVIYIARERLGIIGERVMGAADLVAEVLSPGTRRRDRLDKRDLYEQHGVKEFWLIDPEAQTVEVLFLERGEYQLAGRWQPGERAASRLLQGFDIPVQELFERGLSGQGAE